VCACLLCSSYESKRHVCRDGSSWPFSLITMQSGIRNAGNDDGIVLRTYKPESDFLMSCYNLPRLLVEVQSKSETPNEDFTRMILQGTAIVRFVNNFLDAFKSKKDFVLVAIYIHNGRTGGRKLDLYYLFQPEDVSKVCYTLYIVCILIRHRSSTPNQRHLI
jgi:hypothetical protein